MSAVIASLLTSTKIIIQQGAMWLANLLLVFIISFHCEGLVRDKRIIYGGYVGEQDPRNYYSAIKYYAWISNGRECDINIGLTSHWEIPLPTFLNLHCTPDPWHLLCGGAVITGDVIATACHCIASYDAPTGNYSRRQARAYNHWERFSTIFIGSRTDTHAYHYGTRSRGFFIHRKCALLTVAGYESWLVHDYGWIYLEKSLLFSPDAWVKGGLALGFAPSYAEQELAKMFYKVVNKQLVCLYIGYGRYEFIKGTADETNENSQTMKYGFNVMMDIKSCRDNTDVYIPPGEKPVFKYEDDASWSCSERFGLNSPSRNMTTALFGHGDSGGPVTCDNFLLGVVSQGKTAFYNKRIRGTIMMTNCNVFAAWQNAANYKAGWGCAGCNEGPPRMSRCWLTRLAVSSTFSFLKVIKGLQEIPNLLPTFRPFIPNRRFFEYQITIATIPPTSSGTSGLSCSLLYISFTALLCVATKLLS